MDEHALRAQLRFFRGYAVVMSALAAVFLIGAVSGARRSASFDTIDARVVHVRDRDGTLRLALFGKDDEPPDVLGGKAYPGRAGGPDADAGLMFYNDERDEIGGLIYDGRRTAAGAARQSQSLTFDAYRQDQVVQLFHQQDGAVRSAGLVVSDRPGVSLAAVFPKVARLAKLPPAARAAAIARLRREGDLGYQRFFAGLADRAATVSLRDAAGRVRLRLSVAAGGAQTIEFLDADGRVRRTL